MGFERLTELCTGPLMQNDCRNSSRDGGPRMHANAKLSGLKATASPAPAPAPMHEGEGERGKGAGGMR